MAFVRVDYDYDATQPDELTMKKGDIVSQVNKMDGGWWEGVHANGKKGVFPDNFVTEIPADQVPRSGPPVKQASQDAGRVQGLKDVIGNQIRVQPPVIGGAKKMTPRNMHAGRTKMAVVLFDYHPDQPDELALKEGETLEITKQEEEGWWEGILRGKRGVFPSNFVKEIKEEPGHPNMNGRSISPKPNNQPGASYRPPKQPLPEPVSEPPRPVKNMPIHPNKMPDNEPPPELPMRKAPIRAKVLFSYQAANEDELTLDPGQIIEVTNQKLEDAGWWKGKFHGKEGVFPDNFVELIREEPEPLAAKDFNRLPKPAASERQSVFVKERDQPSTPVKPVKPAVLPPKEQAPIRHHDMNTTDTHMNQINKTASLPQSQPPTQPVVDDRALLALKAELDRLKTQMVTREQHDSLKRELMDAREALDAYKRDNNKQLANLMSELDQAKKAAKVAEIDMERIRKLADASFINK